MIFLAVEGKQGLFDNSGRLFWKRNLGKTLSNFLRPTVENKNRSSSGKVEIIKPSSKINIISQNSSTDNNYKAMLLIIIIIINNFGLID